ncbi:P44/Msp2 family outer membrane protein [Neoehrlichia mikurensis]|uniref:P44/Msp2 family outer membrane protein n=1 Tax=Neoehrlichia mikurensis TaxID=89586 RepID=UPI001C44AB54|nr:P44/Msp2 family outer membrane protein [Neoehrlichia mikurensis]QXK92804.1 P44/Msp2 family outer membrane protein [Neoehrlichia mikurensis]
MGYKNYTCLVIFVVAVVLSAKSFSQSFSRNFYISSQYKPGISLFSGFSIRETMPGVTYPGLKGLPVSYYLMIPTEKKYFNRHLFDIYYDNNLLGAALSVGYNYSNKLRIEVEGTLEHFNPSRGKYKFNSHQYFSLGRKQNGNGSENVSDFVVLKNEGISFKSGIVNICYDVMRSEGVLSPYMCVGAGIENVSFLKVNEPKFTYQAKFGMNYYTSSNIVVFCGAYYHGISGSEYRRIPFYNVTVSSDPKITDASAHLNTAYFGAELGLRLTL